MRILRSSFIFISSCGLSFATFSAMGQTIDVYPTTVAPEKVKANPTAKSSVVTHADNTKRNEKVTKNAEVTAQDQGNSQADVNLAAKVRRAIMDDNSLSVNAQNVKIIAINGHIVLKGPVKNDSERTRLSQIANNIVGADNVKNELEVSH